MRKRLLPKAYAALLSYLAFSPVYLLPAAVLIPDRLWLAAALPVPALLLTGLAGLQPARRRTFALILALLLMAGGCAALFLASQPLGLLMFLPCAATMLAFMPAMTRPAHQEWSLKQLGAGLVLHIAVQFVKNVAVFQVVATQVSWMLVCYLILFLFSYNRTVLVETGSTSAAMLIRQNRRLLMVFCLLTLLLANLKAVGTAVRTGIGWIITNVSAALLWLTSLFSQTTEEGAAAPGGENPFAVFYKDTEPSLLSQILEIVIIAVGILIAAVLLFFACKVLYRLLRRASQALMDRLRLFGQRISADYEDQTETLFAWGEIQKTAAKRMRRIRNRLLPTSWEALSPDQRVRRVYRTLLHRASAANPALTAQEMLKSGALGLPSDAAMPAAALYDRARYSTHPISAQEADDLRKRAGV
ncbi:MAG TPA: hypothetical protein PKU80_02540 [Candidatus Limiplasma sp.]|nr:hypothetical protein [Candidatus Limiplasma sp.]HRX08944.1 hypothetical protein [Candidatus Limiplasma sp.]